MIEPQKDKRIRDLIAAFGDLIKNDLSKKSDEDVSREIASLATIGINLLSKTNKESIALNECLQTLTDIHGKAADLDRNSIAITSARHLTHIFNTSFAKYGMSRATEHVFGYFNQILKDARRFNSQTLRIVSFDWYFTNVFSHGNLGPQILETLPALNKKLFNYLVQIISDKDQDTFKSFISSCVDGIYAPKYVETDIEGFLYGLDIFDNQERHHEWSELEKKVSAFKKNLLIPRKPIEIANDWIQISNSIKTLISSDPSAPEKQVAALDDLTQNIFRFIAFNSLLDVIFVLGARCYAKNEILMIKEILEYNQPSDADATYGNHDAFLSDPEKFITRYLGDDDIDRDYMVWDGHHGSGHYLDKYFLLVLGYILKKRPESEYLPRFNTLESLSNSKISNAIYISEKLQTYIPGMEKELIFKTIADYENKNIANRIKITLEQLKKSCKKILEIRESTFPVDPLKIDKFKSDFEQQFNKQPSLEKFFDRLGSRKITKIKRKEDGFITSKLNVLFDRAAFILDWIVHYGNFAADFADGLIRRENELIIKKIIEKSSSLGFEKFPEVLRHIKRNAIILTSEKIGRNYLTKHEQFYPFWRLTKECRTKEMAPDLRVGCYHYKDRHVAVFTNPYAGELDDKLIISSKKDIGTIKRFNYASRNIEDHQLFKFQINDLAENNEIRDKIIVQRDNSQSVHEIKNDDLKKNVQILISAELGYFSSPQSNQKSIVFRVT